MVLLERKYITNLVPWYYNYKDISVLTDLTCRPNYLVTRSDTIHGNTYTILHTGVKIINISRVFYWLN